MVNEKKILNFAKEGDGQWYVECQEWEMDQTRAFRESYMKEYSDPVTGDTKFWKYLDEQDLDNPIDDHTRHKDWSAWQERWLHQPRMVDESLSKLLDLLAEGKKSISLDIITNSWVSNTFTHVKRNSIDNHGAEYEILSRTDLPSRFRVTPMFRYIFSDLYPLYFHVKRVLK